MMESPKILIVEDNELSLKMANKLLEMAGYQTINAMNAEESIRLAIQYSPDLILMDMHLPDKNGYFASQELKSIPETAHIPIVAFTALAMPEEQKKAIQHGCVGIISKPINATNFAKTVSSYLPSDKATSRVKTQINQEDSNFGERFRIALTPALMPLQELLVRMSYETVLINDQPASLVLPNEAYDLFIIDEPYLEGLEPSELNHLKKELFQKNMPTILATSFFNKENLRVVEEWVSDYITIPFLPPEVELRVRSVIRANKARQNRASFTVSNSLEDFLQTASHDLQGPIRKISQFVEFLSQEKQNDGLQNEYYLRGISRNIQKMESVLANLLSSVAKFR